MDKALCESLKFICQKSTPLCLGEKNIYFKHFGMMDHIGVEEKYSEYFDYAVKKGVPKEEEQLKYCIKEGIWEEAKEKQIESLKNSLKYNEKSLSNLIFGTQRKEIEKQIEIARGKLNDLISDRIDKIGITAESIAFKKSNEYFIYVASYKDEKLSEKWFDSEEDFYDVEEVYINILVGLYNKAQARVSSETIKKITINPFFMNVYRLIQDPIQFFDLPPLSLSFLQVELLNYAETFKRILSEAGVPDTIRDDPDKLINWYNGKHKTAQEVQKGDIHNKTGAAIVGASREELAAAGLGQGMDLREQIREKGIRSKEQIMKLFGS